MIDFASSGQVETLPMTLNRSVKQTAGPSEHAGRASDPSKIHAHFLVFRDHDFANLQNQFTEVTHVKLNTHD